MKITKIDDLFKAYAIIPYESRDWGEFIDDYILHLYISQITEEVLSDTGILLHVRLVETGENDRLYRRFYQNRIKFDVRCNNSIEKTELKKVIILFVQKLIVKLEEKVSVIVFSDETLFLEVDTDETNNKQYSYYSSKLCKELRDRVFSYNHETEILELGAPFFWTVDDFEKELKVQNDIKRHVINRLEAKQITGVATYKVDFWIRFTRAHRFGDKECLSEQEKQLIITDAIRMLSKEIFI